MTLWESYSIRARRVIFWAHTFAVKECSREITPEHILRALLLEDPDLFGVVMPGNSALAGRLEQDLDSGGEEQAGLSQPGKPPLSAAAKRVVAGAGRERERLGHEFVATQHLLLALVTRYESPRTWFARRKRFDDSLAGRILVSYGITPEVVESKTKEGIVTPATGVLSDPVIKLNAQLTALAELLVSKGLFTRAEFVKLLDRNDDPQKETILVAPLIDALFQKGKLTAGEKAAILRAEPK